MNKTGVFLYINQKEQIEQQIEAALSATAKPVEKYQELSKPIASLKLSNLLMPQGINSVNCTK